MANRQPGIYLLNMKLQANIILLHFLRDIWYKYFLMDQEKKKLTFLIGLFLNTLLFMIFTSRRDFSPGSQCGSWESRQSQLMRKNIIYFNQILPKRILIIKIQRVIKKSTDTIQELRHRGKFNFSRDIEEIETDWM